APGPQDDKSRRITPLHFRTFALTHSRTFALTHSRTHALTHGTTPGPEACPRGAAAGTLQL
ncbi:MAG: hypothetical protein AVDCRST_MAG89-1800, partial [uncultured Gemmatimonadetes bacterium]